MWAVWFLIRLIPPNAQNASQCVEVWFRRLWLPQAGGLCQGRRGLGSGAKLMIQAQWASNTRRRSRSKLARPNILRLIIFSLFTCPSTGPWLHSSSIPA